MGSIRKLEKVRGSLRKYQKVEEHMGKLWKALESYRKLRERARKDGCSEPVKRINSVIATLKDILGSVQDSDKTDAGNYQCNLLARPHAIANF